MILFKQMERIFYSGAPQFHQTQQSIIQGPHFVKGTGASNGQNSEPPRARNPCSPDSPDTSYSAPRSAPSFNGWAKSLARSSPCSGRARPARPLSCSRRWGRFLSEASRSSLMNLTLPVLVSPSMRPRRLFLCPMGSLWITHRARPRAIQPDPVRAVSLTLSESSWLPP